VIDVPNYEDLPVETDPESAVWAQRLVAAIFGDAPEPHFDLDYVERMVQAIRNEAARGVCLTYEKTLAQVWNENWRKP
jgi:hypothetical protein